MILVNQQRLWDSLMEMATIGATAHGGSCRLALSDDDARGRRRFIAWCEAAGCEIRIDPIGNVFARRPGTEPGLPPVTCGSHLDTQPLGGRFDGVYGVLAGLEAIRTLNERGIETRHPIDVVAWTNEEGSRFTPGMMAGRLRRRAGSRLRTGSPMHADGRAAARRTRTRGLRRPGARAADAESVFRSAYRARAGAGAGRLADRRRDGRAGHLRTRRHGDRLRVACRHDADERAPRRDGRGGRDDRSDRRAWSHLRRRCARDGWPCRVPAEFAEHDSGQGPVQRRRASPVAAGVAATGRRHRSDLHAAHRCAARACRCRRSPNTSRWCSMRHASSVCGRQRRPPAIRPWRCAAARGTTR